MGDFDFAVNESCVEYRECEALTPFIAQGKPVLHVEYDLDTNDASAPSPSRWDSGRSASRST